MTDIKNLMCEAMVALNRLAQALNTATTKTGDVDLSKCDEDPCGEYAHSLHLKNGSKVLGVFDRGRSHERAYLAVYKRPDGLVFAMDFRQNGKHSENVDSDYDLIMVRK